LGYQSTPAKKVTMNRIAIAETQTSSIPSPTSVKQSHELINRFRRTQPKTDLPYSTFAPIHYEERYAYPLLIWLHGDSSSEQELRQIMPLVSMRNYVAVAPRGSSMNGRKGGHYDWRQTPDTIEAAESRIADCIAVAKDRFNIHEKRIFLVGRESGATMALRVAWNDPERYAGVGAFNGPLPSQLSPMRRVNELRNLPCLLTTSQESTAYPQASVCRDLRLLHSAGCKVTLRHYPGPDDLTDIMLSDLNNWLMELVCAG
jgi:phospholipase/carboxylesterase